MPRFTDHTGKLAHITKGCVMGWEEKHQLVKISSPGDNPRLFWDGDDKRLVRFIRSEQDFVDFASFLADVHGLGISMMAQGRYAFPTIEFV